MGVFSQDCQTEGFYSILGFLHRSSFQLIPKIVGETLRITLHKLLNLGPKIHPQEGRRVKNSCTY